MNQGTDLQIINLERWLVDILHGIQYIYLYKLRVNTTQDLRKLKYHSSKNTIIKKKHMFLYVYILFVLIYTYWKSTYTHVSYVDTALN